jgi:hypothetical protein
VSLIGILVGWGVPQKLVKPLLIGIGALLLIFAIFAGVKIHDHRVIKQHQAEQDAANAKADRAADQKAADQRRTDDARVTTETQEINHAISEAKRSGTDPRSAYYQCVKLQQAARAAKRVVPACV